MYTFSGTPTTIVTVTHRASDYSDEDLSLIHSEFAFLNNIRTRGYQIPAAGGGTDLLLLLEFLGVSAASGIIGQLAYNLLDKISKAMLNLYHHRTNEFPLLHFDDVSLVYDDVTITIKYLNPEVIENLPVIMNEIQQLISHLSESPPHEIQLPIYFDGREFSGWNKNQSMQMPKYPFRYWLLTVQDASASSSRIYDRDKKVIIDMSLANHNQTKLPPEQIETDDIDSFLEALLIDQSNYSAL